MAARVRTPLAAALAAAAVLLAAAAPAHAAGYRYWSFWQRTGAGTWTYAQTGPAAARTRRTAAWRAGGSR